MSIRARITRIKADAQRRANEIYDPYASRESKIRNEEYAIALREASEAELREEHGLSEQDVERLVREYLQRQGVNISEP